MMKHILKRIVTSPGLIAVVAFAFRMGMLMRVPSGGLNPVRTNLPFGYELGAVAASIASGHGFSSPLRWFATGPTAWFAPIYPYLTAAVFKLFGIYSYSSYLVLESINGALSALTCIPIFLAGKKSFGIVVGACAAWAWVVLPTAVLLPLRWIWDTAFSALCMAVILYVTLLLRDAPSLRNWAGYGVLWTFAALLNPSLLATMPFLVGWVILELRRNHASWGRGFATCALLFAIGLLPWTVRNALVFHKLIPLRGNFGLEFWLGNNPGTVDNDNGNEHPNDNLAEAQIYRRMGETAYMAEKQHEAMNFIRSHPADAARLTFHRVVSTWLGTWDPFEDTWRYEPWWERVLQIYQIAFSLLAFIGALLAFRSRNPDAAPYAMIILFYPATFYLTHGSARYRHPIDPILTLLAVFALTYPFRMLARSTGAEPGRGGRSTEMESLTS
ncbi:MAG: hypothetical protein WA871_08640 [Candidatus Acidiferrales bacterium]